jgi:hypothetical protein
MALTKQEVFDRVCDHFKTQKVRSHFGGLCAYLTDDGLKCAIGIFIPDGHQAAGSGGSFREILHFHPDIRNLFEKDDDMVSFLLRLQSIHDDTYTWNEEGFNCYGWQRMRNIAKKYNLNTSHIG